MTRRRLAGAAGAAVAIVAAGAVLVAVLTAQPADVTPVGGRPIKGRGIVQLSGTEFWYTFGLRGCGPWV